ncbi:MAG: DUF4494 domain-containing protein [Bacteroidota bacterium]
MSSWFECKVRYEKMDNEGKQRTVNEPYMVDAVSFTEAESRIYKELEPYISGEFNVTNIKIGNYSELIPHENGDRWFKCKVTFITLDEKKGKERKTSTNMLVQANDIKEAFDRIEDQMRGTISDYTIQTISESPICDVFPYFTGEGESPEVGEKETKME